MLVVIGELALMAYLGELLCTLPPASCSSARQVLAIVARCSRLPGNAYDSANASSTSARGYCHRLLQISSSDRVAAAWGALQHGAARTVFDNRVRLSARAKNRLNRTVADNGMHAIGARDYVAVLEVNAIVIPGSDDGKRVRARADYGRYVAIGPKERSNAGLRLVVVKHGPSNHP